MRGTKTLFRVTYVSAIAGPPKVEGRESRIRGDALSCRGRGDGIRPIGVSNKTIKSRIAAGEEAM